MKFIKKNLKLIIIVVISLLIIGAVILFIVKNNNPYKNKGIKGFHYRVYQDKIGWSKWCVNGEICGKKGYAITNITFKMGDSKYNSLYYNFAKNNTFMSEFNYYDVEYTNNKNVPLNGISLYLGGKAEKDFNIYYKTYNKKNGWLKFSNTGLINGSKDQNIEQIQIITTKGRIDDSDSKKEYNYELEFVRIYE